MLSPRSASFITIRIIDIFGINYGVGGEPSIVGFACLGIINMH